MWYNVGLFLLICVGGILGFVYLIVCLVVCRPLKICSVVMQLFCQVSVLINTSTKPTISSNSCHLPFTIYQCWTKIVLLLHFATFRCVFIKSHFPTLFIGPEDKTTLKCIHIFSEMKEVKWTAVLACQAIYVSIIMRCKYKRFIIIATSTIVDNYM